MRRLVGLRPGRAALGAALFAVLAVVVVLAAAGAAGSIVVVRRSGGRDSLWSVDPVSKSPTELVALPFRPARVELSPGGLRLAFLSMTAVPKVVVYDTHTGVLHTWSLAARGVKVVDSLAWTSSTTLVVAGKPTHGFAFYPFADRLYLLNAVTGASRRFGTLAGTEPTATPSKALLVYVRFIDGGRVAKGSPVRSVIERLYRLKLAAGAKPHLIGSAKYPNAYDIRRFYEPRLSRDGAYLITSTTGSDPTVRYAIRASLTGKAVRTVGTMVGHTTAWSRLGDQVAFWGMPPADEGSTTVLYVYHTAVKSLRHSSKLSNVAVTGLGWSSDDALLAYSLVSTGSADFAPDMSELWTLDPASLAAQTDLGAGGLPVFMPSK